MTSQCSVVYFDVNLKIFVKVVRFKETNNSFYVNIILMFCWFHWFRLYKERAFESFAASIVARFGKHYCQMFFFTFHVGVQKTHIAFATAPEYVVRSTQFYPGV